MRALLSVVIAGFTAVPLGGQHSDTTQAIAAAGSIQGSVRDSRGVLPGVTVTVVSGDLRKSVVTDISGSYEFPALPAGTYTVTAALAGFVDAVRNGVAVRSAERARVDFVVCLASLEYIDWIAPRDLRAMWTEADVVARVEITGTRPVVPDCVQNGYTDTATVREVLKDGRGLVTGQTLSFAQEIWAEERSPYPAGQELIVFLVAAQGGLQRLAGPSSVFYVNGDHVSGRGSRYLGAAGTMPIVEFLAKLRTFERETAPPTR